MIKWNSDSSFSIDEVNFTLTLNKENLSEGDNFTILKPKSKVDRYFELARNGFNPQTILELGFGLGGSTVFLDKLFEPGKISAIDISTSKIDQLQQYTLKHSKFMKFHYGIKQSDVNSLVKLVKGDFLESPIDLIVDDASHWYNPTKKSLMNLFPFLSNGGKYVIETWGWSFKQAQQSEDHSWYNKESLVNIIFECIEDLASNSLISDIQIFKDMFVITKSKNATDSRLFSVERRRNREMPKL